MRIVTQDLPLNHHYIGINSTIPFFLIVNNDENTKTYHSPNDYQINVWDMMLKEKFPNSPAWTMQIRYDADSISDSNTLVISSYDVDLAKNTAGAKQITVIDGGSINSIQSVNNIDTLNTINTLDSVNEVKKVLEVDKINNLYKGEFLDDYKLWTPNLNKFKTWKNSIYGQFSHFKHNTPHNGQCNLFAFTDISDYSSKIDLATIDSEYIFSGDFFICPDVKKFKESLKTNYSYLSRYTKDSILQLFEKNSKILYIWYTENVASNTENIDSFTGYIY